MPAIILEKKKSTFPKLGKNFMVHAICYNCWIGMNKNIDFWKAGHGFKLNTTNYFGII